MLREFVRTRSWSSYNLVIRKEWYGEHLFSFVKHRDIRKSHFVCWRWKAGTFGSKWKTYFWGRGSRCILHTHPFVLPFFFAFGSLWFFVRSLPIRVACSRWFSSPLMLNNVGLRDRLPLFSLQPKWARTGNHALFIRPLGMLGSGFALDSYKVVLWHRCVMNQSRFLLRVFTMPVRMLQPLSLRQDRKDRVLDVVQLRPSVWEHNLEKPFGKLPHILCLDHILTTWPCTLLQGLSIWFVSCFFARLLSFLCCHPAAY